MTEDELETFELYGVTDFRNMRTLEHHHAYLRKIHLAKERIAVLNNVNMLWRPLHSINKCEKAIQWNYKRIKEIT